MKLMASVNLNLVQKFLSSRKSEEENVVPYQSEESENILTGILKIILWDNPFMSCFYFFLVNFIFCLMITLDLKFYGVICTILLIITCEQLQAEIFSRSINKFKSNFQNLTSHSLETSNQRLLGLANSRFFRNFLNKLNDTYVKAKLLRQSQPGVFCILTCLCFLVIGIIGKLFPTPASFYLAVMTMMTVPGALFQLLPPEVAKSFWDMLQYNRKDDDDSDDEMGLYLMDTTEEALNLLNMASDLQLPSKEEDEESNDLLLDHMSERTNDTMESNSSKFFLDPELAFMPSPENSMEFWESDVSHLEKAESSENRKNDINFQSQHFDGDSSDDEFVNGLNLSEKSVKENKGEQQLSNSELTVENLISSGKKILETQSNPQSSTGNDRESSSDTDSFELISEGDM